MNTIIRNSSCISYKEFCENDENWLFVWKNKVCIRDDRHSCHIWNGCECFPIDPADEVWPVKQVTVDI